MSKKPDSREVATTEAGLPAFMDDMSNFAGANVSDRAEDFVLPFLMIAQGLSPQLNRRDGKYIEGLEQGDIYNTATGEFWRGDEGIVVVPFWYAKQLVEWVPRKEGGGWVASHPIGDPIHKEMRFVEEDGKKVPRLPNGHDLIETAYYSVISAADGEPAVVSMSSTGLGASRIWQTLIKKTRIPNTDLTAPSFARAYRLGTVPKSNASGNWYTWKVVDEGWAPPNLYALARARFVAAEEAGGVQMGRPPEGGEAPASPVEDEVPF